MEGATTISDSNSTTNKTTILLPIGSCFFLDFPDEYEDCDYSDDDNEQIFCYDCHFHGKFFTGESLDDYYRPGHIICFIISVLVVIVGVFGALANLLIIAVLRRKKNRKAFDTFLMTLAGYDIICSVFPVLLCVGSTIYFQNWNRGPVPLYLYYIGTYTGLLGRAGSAYTTVVISFERYVVVAFAYSTRTRNWFNHRMTRILALSSFTFALLMTLPRYTSHYVARNELGQNINSARGVKYLIMSTRLHRFFYVNLKGYFNLIEFWAPLPLLLLFNGLVYLYIYRHYSKTSVLVLDLKRRNDIRIFRMFLPVVVALFLCNLTPIVMSYYLLKGIYYRELGLGVGLSYVVNSAVNLPIYYLGGARFRRETKEIIKTCFPCIAACLGINKDDDHT